MHRDPFTFSPVIARLSLFLAACYKRAVRPRHPLSFQCAFHPFLPRKCALTFARTVAKFATILDQQRATGSATGCNGRLLESEYRSFRTRRSRFKRAMNYTLSFNDI